MAANVLGDVESRFAILGFGFGFGATFFGASSRRRRSRRGGLRRGVITINCATEPQLRSLTVRSTYGEI